MRWSVLGRMGDVFDEWLDLSVLVEEVSKGDGLGSKYYSKVELSGR